MTRRPRPSKLWLAAVVLLSVTACAPTKFRISNDTGHDRLVVRVESADDPLEVIVGPVSTEVIVGGDGCYHHPVVAYGPEGEELARLDEGACEGSVWVVEADGGRLER